MAMVATVSSFSSRATNGASALTAAVQSGGASTAATGEVTSQVALGVQAQISTRVSDKIAQLNLSNSSTEDVATEISALIVSLQETQADSSVIQSLSELIDVLLNVKD
jgi:hypothetical protein